MVALMRERKGLETLLQALPMLRRRHNVRLRIVGPFECSIYQQQIQDLAAGLNIQEWIDWALSS